MSLADTFDAQCAVSVAAGTDDEYYILQPHPGTYRLTELWFAPQTAAAIDGTDFMTINITTNDGAGGADSSNVASHNTDTGGTALVLKTSVDLALSGDLDLEVAQGGQVKFAKVETASGVIWEGQYFAVFEKVR